MQFVQVLPCLLLTILGADPRWVPVFMTKVDLSGAYMRVWITPEYLPRIDFNAPPHSSGNDTLIIFHLSLPMGYIYCAPYLCCTIKTVADLANQISDVVATATPHLLCVFANIPPSADNDAHVGLIYPFLYASLIVLTMCLPPNHNYDLLRYINIYVDNFITIA